jgi:hypothetical protein
MDKKEKEKQKQPKSRYRNTVRRTDPRTGEQIEKELGDTIEETDNGETVFTFRRVIPSYGEKYAYSEVDIGESKGLRSILSGIIGPDYPGVNLDGPVINIVSPFACIVSVHAATETSSFFIVVG